MIEHNVSVLHMQWDLFKQKQTSWYKYQVNIMQFHSHTNQIVWQ